MRHTRPMAVMTAADFGDRVLRKRHRGRACHDKIVRRSCLAPGDPGRSGLRANPAAQRVPGDGECARRALTPVSLRRTAAKAQEVAITYAGHSTYYIDTPGGIRIATDYSGAYRAPGRVADVVTMNRAHSTHFTLYPDPKIHACAARLGRERQAGTGQSAVRRRPYPQRHHRHPPLLRRRRQRRDDPGRQFDLHLRGRGPLHRPSRAPAPQARRQPFCP